MAASSTPGDTVVVVWLETQQPETGTVERVEFGAVRIAIAGLRPEHWSSLALWCSDCSHRPLMAGKAEVIPVESDSLYEEARIR